MENDTVRLLIELLVGLIAVPVINYVKLKFGWDDIKAAWLALGMSAIFAVVALLITGAFIPIQSTDPQVIVTKIIEFLILVWNVAQFAYKLILTPVVRARARKKAFNELRNLPPTMNIGH